MEMGRDIDLKKCKIVTIKVFINGIQVLL